MDKLHTKHRLRVKAKFRQNGIDALPDHEVLEFLLFFGIPFKNTNDIAHVLMSRFGSFSNVLEADYDELIKIDGIGENAATFLTLLPHIFRRYSFDKNRNSRTYDTMEKIGEFAVNHFIGETREHVELLLFDSKMNMIDHVTVHEGALSSGSVNLEKVAEIVFSGRASIFVLTHNHPSGSLEPSGEDMFVTRELQRAFEPFNKFLLEHIIVADGKYNCILDKSMSIYDN